MYKIILNKLNRKTLKITSFIYTIEDTYESGTSKVLLEQQGFEVIIDL